VKRPVVLDNTILSNLARVGRADLVERIWGKNAHTTPKVMKEHSAGVESGILPLGSWSGLVATELTKEERETYRALSSRLGEGERSCIAVVQHRGGILVTDDRDARTAAKARSLPTTGTVGVLVLAVKRGLMSLEEGNALLQLMIDRDYRAPVEKLDPLVTDFSDD